MNTLKRYDKVEDKRRAVIASGLTEEGKLDVDSTLVSTTDAEDAKTATYSGISIDKYLKALNDTADIHDIKQNNKTVTSKRQQVTEFIDGLSLTSLKRR